MRASIAGLTTRLTGSNNGHTGMLTVVAAASINATILGAGRSGLVHGAKLSALALFSKHAVYLGT